MIFWFFVILFSVLLLVSLFLIDDADKFIKAAIVLGVLLAGTIAISYYPVKTNVYTVKLNNSLTYKEKAPYDSMDVYTDKVFKEGYYFEFSSYSKKGYLPNDKVRIRDEDVPIHFKKGTKNCIHYKKEVNIFGDESKYADSIVVEYNKENVKKAKETKTEKSAEVSKTATFSSSNDSLNESEAN